MELSALLLPQQRHTVKVQFIAARNLVDQM